MFLCCKRNFFLDFLMRLYRGKVDCVAQKSSRAVILDAHACVSRVRTASHSLLLFQQYNPLRIPTVDLFLLRYCIHLCLSFFISCSFSTHLGESIMCHVIFFLAIQFTSTSFDFIHLWGIILNIFFNFFTNHIISKIKYIGCKIEKKNINACF